LHNSKKLCFHWDFEIGKTIHKTKDTLRMLLADLASTDIASADNFGGEKNMFYFSVVITYIVTLRLYNIYIYF